MYLYTNFSGEYCFPKIVTCSLSNTCQLCLLIIASDACCFP
uniref:Uncharacterized protein n=1 Tax=Arundo donax TaxID=35708 RepID=A0A0A9BZ68_ARUDO